MKIIKAPENSSLSGSLRGSPYPKLRPAVRGKTNSENVSSDKSCKRSSDRAIIRPLKQAANSENDRSQRKSVRSASHLLKISKASDRPTLIFNRLPRIILAAIKKETETFMAGKRKA